MARSHTHNEKEQGALALARKMSVTLGGDVGRCEKAALQRGRYQLLPAERIRGHDPMSVSSAPPVSTTALRPFGSHHRGAEGPRSHLPRIHTSTTRHGRTRLGAADARVVTDATMRTIAANQLQRTAARGIRPLSRARLFSTQPAAIDEAMASHPP